MDHARRIAAAYPAASRRKYVEAAESLRLAYWDWADDSNVPPATTAPTVVISRAVNGTLRQTAVRNPLFSYEYPQSALRSDFGRFDGKNHTKRCVEEGQSYPLTANGIMAGYNLKEKVVSLRQPHLHRLERRIARVPFSPHLPPSGPRSRTVTAAYWR